MNDRPLWLPGIAAALALLILSGWLDGRAKDERLAELIAAQRHAAPLTACPPPAPGMTDTIVLVVESRADAEPLVTGCSRIAERRHIERWRPW
ncbi:MAG TPA: hypothetical protein VJ797_15715 [Burkholderiales bacterium]|nr:hypothetical protein [Burkholderiales bacterium]